MKRKDPVVVIPNNTELLSFLNFKIQLTSAYGERNNVADILHTRNEQNQTFKAKTEARVRTSTETASIEIPPHILHRNVQFLDATHQFFVAFFTFRTTDNFANLREENVHSTNRLAIFVHLHVECLDFLRVVRQNHRLLKVFLNEEAFMLARKGQHPNIQGTQTYGQPSQPLPRCGYPQYKSNVQNRALPRSSSVRATSCQSSC